MTVYTGTGPSYERHFKRPIDLVLVGLAATMTAPIAAVVYLAVILYDGSPAIYKQERVGLHGNTFNIYKFRTMSKGHPDELDHVRITRLGRILRRTSLDELPQLLNVARGEMSLVGPRPLLPRYLPYYTHREASRHSVRPGVTGLAQTQGRNQLGWPERLDLDVRYVNTLSLRLDLKILIRTVSQAVKASSVSVVARDSGDPLDVERSYPASRNYRLRRIYMRDLPVRVEWLSDASTQRLMRIAPDLNLTGTQQWYASIQNNQNRVDFAFCPNNSDAPLAMGGLKRVSNGTWELYIFVDPHYRGNGLGNECTKLMIQWAQYADNVSAVGLSVHKDNRAAMRIYLSQGFAILTDDGNRLWMQIDTGPEVCLT